MSNVMTSLDTVLPRRVNPAHKIPAPACGPMPRLLFWKLALSATIAAARLLLRRL